MDIGTSSSRARRGILTLLLVATSFAALLVGTPGSATAATAAPSAAGSATAATADLSQFDPGNIISDAVFFNSGTMTPATIQTFLNSKVPGCQAGYTCLRDFVQDTWTRPADPMCGTYTGAPRESAATIIYKVAQACRVNPQVLLVLLQKEQSLVTKTAPTSGAYRSATGYGCSDTSPCDAEFYGFFNQVYKAAWAFQRYAMPPGTGPGTAFPSVYSRYRAGQWADVLFNPNAGCGTSRVFIQNQATASLYFYTPYQPNAAALAAGYGIGDGCSTYGNRNFFNFFTDWFGPTRSLAPSNISKKYGELGGASGVLGAATGPLQCGLRDDGCWQPYANGGIYASRVVAAHYVIDGPVRTKWAELGWEHAVPTSLGYPATDPDVNLRDGGSWQGFEWGAIYSSPATGTQVILSGVIRDAWASLGWEHPSATSLGYPIGSTVTGLRDRGQSQDFERGAIYSSPLTSTRVVPAGPLLTGWRALAAQDGVLGYPTRPADTALRNGGAWQQFEKGALYSSPAGSFYILDGPIKDAWASLGWEHLVAGSLGYPTSSTTTGLPNGGSWQQFEKGALYASPATGARVVLPGEIEEFWQSLGGPAGALGYPTSAMDPRLRDGGAWQEFQHGAVYSSSFGTFSIANGPIRTAWVALKWEHPVASSLGYPRESTVAGLVGGGLKQAFEKGVLYSSPQTGTYPVRTGAILDFFSSQGAESGVLGYPTGIADTALRNGGSWQPFQNGGVYASSFGSFFILNGPIRQSWAARGWEHPVATSLGYPTSSTVTGLVRGGSSQQFERGTLYASAGTAAALVVDGPIRDAWLLRGAQDGVLGYPTADPRTVAGGTVQTFQGGTLEYSTATGTVTVR